MGDENSLDGQTSLDSGQLGTESLYVDSPQEDIDTERLKSEIKSRENLILGICGGVVGAILWGIVTYVTNYQIGYMAIALGFIVAVLVQKLGRGYSPIFGIVGAILAVVGCILGDFFTIVGVLAHELQIGLFDAFSMLNMEVIRIYIEEMTKEPSSFITLLFWVIAIGTGFKRSWVNLDSMTSHELADLHKRTYQNF